MTKQPHRSTVLSALWRKWRMRTRRDIALLDNRGIRDLGVSRGQMAFEARKPFWRT